MIINKERALRFHYLNKSKMKYLKKFLMIYKIENVFCKRLRNGERTRPDNPFTKGPISKMKTTIILIKIGLDFIDLLQGCRGPINPAPVAINSLPKNDHFKTRNRVFAS